VAVITDIQPAVRDNEELIGQVRSASASRDGLRSRSGPIFYLLFDNYICGNERASVTRQNCEFLRILGELGEKSS
jgi:hypothetical protein